MSSVRGVPETNQQQLNGSDHDDSLSSLTAEQAVLGSVLCDPDAWAAVEKLLTEEDFYQERHRFIFSALRVIAEEGRRPDCVTVYDLLERRGEIARCGGLEYLRTVADRTLVPANIADYADALLEHTQRRRIAQFAENLSRSAHVLIKGQTATDLLTDAQSQLEQLRSLARPSSPVEPRIRFLGLEEFVVAPKVSYQIGRIDPGRAIVVVFGPPKGGKTFSVCDLTMHAAHGLDWHGCKVSRPLRIAYLAGEGLNGLRVRLKAWLEHHDRRPGEGTFRIFPGALGLPETAVELAEALREFAPDGLVVDTLNAYFGPGDENATQDMTAFCAAVRYLRDALGCSVYVIHHSGHADSGRERGSIVLRASADVLIQVAKGGDESPDLVGFQVIAARDLEPMPEAISLRLSRHHTEWTDSEGIPLASCIVSAASQTVTLPGRGPKPLGEAQAGVLAIIRELASAAQPSQSGEIILARSEISQLAKSRAISKSSLHSAWASLANRGHIRLIEPASVAVKVTPR
jgi:hypothetical protein